MPAPKISKKAMTLLPEEEQLAHLIANRVHRARREARETQESLAARADLSSMTLKRLEAAKGLPDLRTVYRLATAQGVTLTQLLQP